MSRILKDIVFAKRADLTRILSANQTETEGAPHIPFRKALLHSPAPALICEIKKASPSQGVICEDFDPQSIARDYSNGGATALSVLTDERFFQGAPENVSLAKSACGLPVLCKDFFIDPRQVLWAKRIGADALLLILRILSDAQAGELLAASVEQGLDVLVETHDENDIERAVKLGATIIGVNNRDLDTFAVNLETSERLRDMIPADALAIAESGIEGRDDVRRLQAAGYNTFLIGGSLMRAADKKQAVRLLRGEEC